MANVKLRPDQYRRLGRISDKNEARAERVGERMLERRTRVPRGKDLFDKLVSRKEASTSVASAKPPMKKGGKVAPNKAYGGMMMKKGGKMKKSK